jgi:immunity protein Imm1 of predicted polymorphic toxin system
LALSDTMSQRDAIVSWWSRKDEGIHVSNVAELDHTIDGVIKSECDDYPTVVEIKSVGYLFTLAVGLPESFVQIANESHLQPYLVAVNKDVDDKEGSFNFYFQGLHHTEIPRRYILPISKARELARAYLIKGTIPEGVEWDEL